MSELFTAIRTEIDALPEAEIRKRLASARGRGIVMRRRSVLGLLVALCLLWAAPAFAVITQTHLTDGNSTPFGGHVATTSSFTPSANKLQLLTLWVQGSFGDPSPLSVSTTTGLTWVLVNSADILTAGRGTTYVYRAMKSSGLSNGTVTFTFTGFIDVFQWSIDEFDGVDTTGTDGSGAVVQSATGSDDAVNGFADAPLAAFGSTNNGTYMGGGAFDGSAFLTGFTATSGFTNITSVVGGE